MDARRGRILVVDDEPLVLRAMQRMLRDHEVVCVREPQNAISLLDDGDRFDIIFSDVMMARMTGLEMYKRLLAARVADVRRIVFVTGGALDPQVAQFLAVIPNASFEKPLIPAKLRAFVQQRLAMFEAALT